MIEGTPAVFAHEAEIAKWDYNQSVAKMKPKVDTLKTVLIEVVRELYIAKQALCRPGATKGEANEGRYTYMQYLEDIGLSYKQAASQIAWYLPEEDRLKTKEEMDGEKGTSIAALASERSRMREARIAYFMQTGERPEGWDEGYDEPELKRRLEDKARRELIERWMSKRTFNNYRKRRDYFADAMAAARDYQSIKLENREQQVAQAQISEMVKGYLLSFQNPQTLMAAAFNIGLRIRDLVNDVVEDNGAGAC